MTRLSSLLKLERWGAVGIMESLWHFAAKHAIQGDIGKWKDEEISAAIGWGGDSIQLITALVDAGWIDRCKTHRLLIHDWEEHADESVKKTIHNRGIDFHHAEPFRKIRENSGRVGTKKGSGSGSGKALAEGGAGETKDCPCGFDLFWKAYPKKAGGKEAASKAFQAAIKRLKEELQHQGQDPVEFLIAKATEFATTPKGKAGKFCPYPATWLNKGCYDDDPATWRDCDKSTHPTEPIDDLEVNWSTGNQ